MIEVLKFSATWCAPCRALAATLDGIEGITDIDIDSNIELATKHHVRSVPLLIFQIDGKEVHRQTGNMSKIAYEKIISELYSSKELWEKQ